MVTITNKDSLKSAWSKGYNDSDEGIWNTTKGITSASWQYTRHNPYRVLAGIFAVTAAALTATYFLSPSYKASVNGVVKGISEVMNSGYKAFSTFASANPAFASFLGVMALAAVVTIVALAVVNRDRGKQIDGVKEVCDDVSKDPAGKLDAITQLLVGQAKGNNI
ncbi:MAG: hypothetical protein PV340_02825 [Wolbachia sp.]|nr:hypothetical protein [Wolbachia sp.]MDD9335878.1 hypothetical protein [Wolbachia sp.]